MRVLLFLIFRVVFLLEDNALFGQMFPDTFFQYNFPSIGLTSTEKIDIIDKIAKKIKKEINDVIENGSKLIKYYSKVKF